MSVHQFEQLRYIETSTSKELDFVCIGNPPVQQRAKITYKNKYRPLYCDPSNCQKKKWRKQLNEFLIANNILTPVFCSSPLTNNGIKLSIIFYLNRPSIDYKLKKV